MEHRAITPPADTFGPRLAADVVTIVREGARIRLDYSPASLSLVGGFLDGIRRERPHGDAVSHVLLCFGAYTGQVLVNGAGAAWVEFDAEQRGTFGQPFGVRTPDGRVWNPLGRVLKRYDRGARESLRAFYRSVVDRATA